MSQPERTPAGAVTSPVVSSTVWCVTLAKSTLLTPVNVTTAALVVDNSTSCASTATTAAGAAARRGM
jgi:hypothetical protein